MASKRVKELVLQALKTVGEESGNNELVAATEKTVLFGSQLDSLGIVTLVTELEEQISDELDVEISLADERAMSQRTSPFRSVSTLINYTNNLIDEQSAG